jgi:hypothetical protein
MFCVYRSDVYFWKPNFSQGNSSIQYLFRYLKALNYVFVSLFVFVLPFAVTFLFFSVYLTHLIIFSRGLCDELITRPEESYRLWCVVCDLENLMIEEALAQWGLSRQKQTYHIF